MNNHVLISENKRLKRRVKELEGTVKVLSEQHESALNMMDPDMCRIARMKPLNELLTSVIPFNDDI